jgi:hypothetical protein
MLTYLGHRTGNILWIKARGELTPADHAEFFARLESLIQKYGKARVLCEVEDVQGADACAAWTDPTSSVRYKGGVRRFAIVGDEKDRAWLTRLCEPFVNARFFSTVQRGDAWRWVTEHVEEDCQEHIRRLAYAKWEAAGRPPGDGVPYWVAAEQELLNAV